MKNIIKSSLYGFIVGDALGVPVEFMSRDKLKEHPVSEMLENKSRNTTKGYWSDDTAMTLCTMQSIVDMKEIDFELHDSMMKNYRKWLEEGYKAVNKKCFGIGQTIFKALSNYRNSKTFIEYSSKNLESPKNGGNGAMMRILPLILYLYNNKLPKYKDLEDNIEVYRKYDFIEFNVGITHQYSVNKECCIFYTMFIFNLLDTKDLNKAYDLSIEQHLSWYSGCQSSELKRILNKEIINVSEQEIKSTGYVIDTLEASLWCLFNTKNYEEAVLKAVNLGGDSDTIAAITGSLAGLYYGIDQIPQKWLDVLCEKDMLENDINNFIEVTIKNKIIDNKFLQASKNLRAYIWMKYVDIVVKEETSSLKECFDLYEELKVELCKFHDYVISLIYKESEKEYRNNILFATELFIDIIEKRIEPQKNDVEEMEKDLLNRFDWLRKKSNESIRIQK